MQVGGRRVRRRASDSSALSSRSSAPYRDHVWDNPHNFVVVLALLAPAMLCKPVCGLCLGYVLFIGVQVAICQGCSW